MSWPRMPLEELVAAIGANGLQIGTFLGFSLGFDRGSTSLVLLQLDVQCHHYLLPVRDLVGDSPVDACMN